METRERIRDYIWKWMVILSPLWLFFLLVLYAIIAGEFTTHYDEVYFPRYFEAPSLTITR